MRSSRAPASWIRSTSTGSSGPARAADPGAAAALSPGDPATRRGTIFRFSSGADAPRPSSGRTVGVNFQLKDLSDSDDRAACDGWAPAFAAVHGLISKVWLADEASNTSGGIYTWADRAAMVAFASSDLFQAVEGNPNLVDITSHDFSILEGPGVVTQARIATAARVDPWWPSAHRRADRVHERDWRQGARGGQNSGWSFS
jgi:hypothetical protein